MSEPLRVMHVVLSLDIGGLERNVINQIHQGRMLGQEITILCIERLGAQASRARELGAAVFCIDKNPGLRLSTSLRIRRILRQVRPHVIHTHQISGLLYSGLGAIGLGIPLIVHTEHGKEAYATRRKTRWLGKIAGRFTQAFYCLTRDMADSVAAQGIVPPGKIRVIMNGIDTAHFQHARDRGAVRRQLGIPDDAPVIGTVGRLSEVKRQDVLLNACAMLRADHPQLRVLLVGDGPLMGSLRQQAANLGLADRVHFSGFQADSAPLLHAMDVFALTSRSEGMPQAILEACCAGVPVIASRVGGIPEVIEDGRSGLLFDVGDAAALANGLKRLLDDRAMATALAAEARRRVQCRFDISRMAREYHGQFLEMLGSRELAAGRECIE